MYSCYMDIAGNMENDNHWLLLPIFNNNKPYLLSSYKYDSLALKQYETAIKLYLPYASLSPTQQNLSAGIQAAPGCRRHRCALSLVRRRSLFTRPLFDPRWPPFIAAAPPCNRYYSTGSVTPPPHAAV